MNPHAPVTRTVSDMDHSSSVSAAAARAGSSQPHVKGGEKEGGCSGFRRPFYGLFANRPTNSHHLLDQPLTPRFQADSLLVLARMSNWTWRLILAIAARVRDSGCRRRHSLAYNPVGSAASSWRCSCTYQ